MAPENGLPGQPSGLSGIFKAPRMPCRSQHARRLLVASAIFAVSLLATLVLVSTFILRDLSDARVNTLLSQAKAEAEAVARMANDPKTMGESETVDSLDAGKDKAIDGDALVGSLLPQVYDKDGRKLDALSKEEPPLLGESTGAETLDDPQHRVPANLSRSGREYRVLVNGEIVARQAVQYIEIRYPGGRQIITFVKTDERDFDRAVLEDPTTHVERQQLLWRPRSQRITMAWDSTIDGQPVTLQAGIDPDILQQGVSELRRKTIPKVVAGAAAFIVLLGIAYVYVFRLLSESRRLEVEASQQALLAQVGILAAGLAHEIRNPLSAVQMNLQLLEEDLEEGAGASRPVAPASAHPGALASAVPTDAVDHVELLRATQREIRRLGSLVSDFLTYARPATPRPAPVRLDALVSDCVELFRANAAGQGIDLDMDLASGEDAVLLDEAMAKQALMNVIKNALEAVPQPGGRVVVTTRRAPGYVQVAVADNGPGLPEQPEQIFRVFHSTKKGGTGLGLPISRALMERQRGTLGARPGAQGGAVFLLTFPAEPPQAPSVAAKAEAAA